MQFIIQGHNFIGEEGKKQIFELLELLEKIDPKCFVSFNDCNFLQMYFKIDDYAPGSMKREFVQWLQEKQAEKVTNYA